MAEPFVPWKKVGSAERQKVRRSPSPSMMNGTIKKQPLAVLSSKGNSQSSKLASSRPMLPTKKGGTGTERSNETHERQRGGSSKARLNDEQRSGRRPEG